ncbi:MAG: hypothetical protein IT440_07395 [Phycisphaeraceae bacterium]|nr:hypothetical protein [Phycisphaeraceae bacterium]
MADAGPLHAVAMRAVSLDRQEPPYYAVGDPTTENLTRLKEAGADTILLWIGYPYQELFRWEWWNRAETMDVLAEVAGRCKALGLKVYYVSYIGAPFTPYFKEGVTLALSKNMAGEGENMPSWVDPAYWNQYIIPRDVALAKLVARGLGQGVLLEAETYGSGARPDIGRPDFGDAAFLPFMKHIGLPDTETPPAERATYLYNKGVLPAYIDWQQQKLRELSEQRKKALLKVAPRVQLGMYAPRIDPGCWFWGLRPLAEGMNQPTRPMLILDANTYPGAPGFLPAYVEQFHSMAKYRNYTTKLMREWGLNAHVVFGLFTYANPGFRAQSSWANTPCMTSEGIRQFLRDAHDAGNGWWIWNEYGVPNEVIADIQAGTQPHK